MSQIPAEFRTQLESYQGPLDLLLYLIRKEEVDVLDIPMGRVTEQYCAYLRILQTVEKHLTAEPPEMLQAIFTDVRAFTKGAAQSDDITALVLRYGG